MGEFSILGLVFALLSSGPNDLLDYIPTDAFWKQKAVAVSVETMTQELKPAVAAGDISKLIAELGSDDFNVREATGKKIAAMGPGVIPQLEKAAKSPDAEVASRAKSLIEQLQTGAMAGNVRRLMAIRALGELKDKKAAAALTPLLASKTMFEADYAAAALAALDGKPFVRPQPDAKARAADLNLLPDKLGVVAQGVQVRPTGKALTVDEAIKVLSKLERHEEFTPEKFVEGAIMVAERTGNIRVGAVTVGVPEDIGNRTGFVLFVFHGEYDPAASRTAFVQFIKDSLEGAPPGMRPESTEIDGVPAIKLPESSGYMLFPDAQRLVVVGGPFGLPEDVASNLAAALKSGKGKIAEDAEMTKLIKTVDTTKPLWMAMRIGENFRKAPPLAVFDTVVATVEPKGADAQLKITATGPDADKVHALVTMVNVVTGKLTKYLENGLKQRENAAPDDAQTFAGILASLKTLKVTAEGTSATVTGTLKDANQTAMLLPAVAELIDRGRRGGEELPDANTLPGGAQAPPMPPGPVGGPTGPTAPGLAPPEMPMNPAAAPAPAGAPAILPIPGEVPPARGETKP